MRVSFIVARRDGPPGTAGASVMQKGAAPGPPRDVQDCGRTGHAPSPPPQHRAEEKLVARAKAGRGDSDKTNRTSARASLTRGPGDLRGPLVAGFMRRGRRQVTQLGQSHEKLGLAHFSA